ncbi:MAG: TlpA disulfide reductase family protein [Ignavibacteriales bacterium]|nr:TlpA disulfide reductase family protein [Ignavibacteriales bacterium]
MKVLASAVVLMVSLCMYSGCQQQPPPERAVWKGTVSLADKKQLPFVVYLDLTPPAPSGYFLNGTEQTPIPEIHHAGDSLTFVFSEYGAAMQSVWKGGKLTGTFLRFRKDTVSNPFEASPSTAPEATTKAKAPSDIPLVGKYQVFMKNREGIDSGSVATFWSRGDSVFGTFIAADGDLGLMCGKQEGNSVQLGRFSGWQGQLMELTRTQNQWSGTLYYRMPPATSFTLVPRPTASLDVRSARQTTMKDSRKPFAFTGTTVLGDTVTNLDTRYKGKVVLIDIMGTWCHNCMDASPLLQKLFTEFNGQGLEVVGLSFELTGDFNAARKNLLLYEERYGITFPVLYCGSLDNANVEARTRSQLNNFFAYPTTLFVDRNGVVQQIHEGFKGPGTGEEYQNEVNLYYETVQKLLKSKTTHR